MAYINGKQTLFPIIKAVDGSVLYSETQELTDEQKQTARENINAVDASLVTDNVSNGNEIPNGNGLVNFITENIHNFPVVSYDHSQTAYMTDEQKQTARNNIGAVSQTELDEAVTAVKNEITGEAWETIADITLEEASAEVVISQDANGGALSLKRMKVIVDTDNTTGFYTATGMLYLGLISAEANLSSRAIYLSNFIPNTADKYSRAIFDVEVIDGIAFVSGRCRNIMKNFSFSETGDPVALSGNLGYLVKNGSVDNIKLSTNYTDGFAIGTHIKVLGVRA